MAGAAMILPKRSSLSYGALTLMRAHQSQPPSHSHCESLPGQRNYKEADREFPSSPLQGRVDLSHRPVPMLTEDGTPLKPAARCRPGQKTGSLGQATPPQGDKEDEPHIVLDEVN